MDEVQDNVFSQAQVDHEDNTVYWLTMAVMADYQDIVLGREQRLKTPARIRKYLAEWHSVEINTRRWAREWQPTWQALWNSISDLDARALKPVAKLVYQYKQAA